MDSKLRCNHVVKTLFNTISEENIKVADVEREAGIGINVINKWKRDREPLLGNVIAALNAIGLELTVTKME